MMFRILAYIVFREFRLAGLTLFAAQCGFSGQIQLWKLRKPEDLAGFYFEHPLMNHE